ncbi:hypothetical protein AEB_P2051 [Altererythrobacter sp. B11]|uniref:hypothetical protein n=1 Tax=Altererythrobacter sp. B11 TaxID=2060312 RepID=UPI000DC70E3E|nr:hypothetical protein [Altererythrobacter sp. B11]BBC72919.1 hypothetical protein AEB_P2051 [Altererythrobacter sp. B11]
MARGFAEAIDLVERLPEEERGRLGYLLAEFAVEISAAQKSALSSQTHGTGYLGQGLDAEVMLDQLRMRAGLLSLRKGRNSRYYGRFVEYGRRAQNVRVIRGTSASKRSATSRRRRAAGRALRKPYTLHVKAMPARPFVYLPDTEARIDRRLAQFWSEALPT